MLATTLRRNTPEYGWTMYDRDEGLERPPLLYHLHNTTIITYHPTTLQPNLPYHALRLPWWKHQSHELYRRPDSLISWTILCNETESNTAAVIVAVTLCKIVMVNYRSSPPPQGSKVKFDSRYSTKYRTLQNRTVTYYLEQFYNRYIYLRHKCRYIRANTRNPMRRNCLIKDSNPRLRTP